MLPRAIAPPRRSRSAREKQDQSPLAFASAASHKWYIASKTIFEFLLALVLLALAAPVLLLLAVCIKVTSRGPVLYAQKRVGKGGRPYLLYKLRTMIHDCEKESGPLWSIPGDPRVTPVGRLLRRSHLDELPQLWNVLKGDMSLIGPRPERPEFVATLERVIPNYRQRLQLRPGITGLAQVQLPADTDLKSVARKLSYDLYYARVLNPWLDFRILLCTGLYMVGVPFHQLRRIFRFPSPERVEGASGSAALPIPALDHAQTA